MAEQMVLSLWGNRKDEAFFRKRFEWNGSDPARIRIFADTGYELFWNGRAAVRVDEWNNTRDYDVTAYLQPGNNLVAVHAINHGGHRGFAFALRLGDTVAAVSDSTWKCADSEVWGWMLPDFDDSAWNAPRILPLECAGMPQWQGIPGDGRFPLIPPQACSPFFYGEMPKCVQSPRNTAKRPEWKPSPEAIAIAGEGYAKSAAAYPEAFPRPAHLFPVDGSGGILTADGRFSVPRTTRYTGPALIVDFGGEAVGYFRFRVESEKPVSFRLHYAETFGETLGEPNRDILQHRMLTEEIRLFAGKTEFESRSRAGFRFVSVEFFDCTAPVTASEFGVRSEIYPVAYRGYFHCSDDLLNNLWRAGRKTVHFCMQEYYIDAVKRDRMLWVGDTRAEALYNYYLFHDAALFRFSWEEMEKSAYADGSIPSAWGAGSSLLWDYIMWYVIAFHDYHQFTGDGDFLKKHAASICRATDFLTSKCNADGLFSVPENPYQNWMVVLDRTRGVQPYYNELYLRVLATAAEACELTGDNAGSGKYRSLADRIRPAVESLLAEHPVSEATSLPHHATGSYAIAEDLFRRGKSTEAMALLRGQWGKMLRETGADTLSEAFCNPTQTYTAQDNRTHHPGEGSYCHGWAAGPAALLPAEVAGIRPLTPGFRRFTVAPAPCDLESLEAAVPTPFGEIALALQRNPDGRYHGELLVPDGCVAELRLNGETRELRSGRHRF